MAALGATLALAATTALFAVVGGHVAVENSKYGAVSNEAAAIYYYEEAMLEASGSYSADLDGVMLSAAYDRTIVADTNSYAVVVQIPTGEIYLSTSASPDPVQVDSEIPAEALPAEMDASGIIAAIDGYEATVGDESDGAISTLAADTLGVVGEWIKANIPSFETPA